MRKTYSRFDAAGAPVQYLGGAPNLNALDTVFGHHGSVLDAQTGLQHKGARWYSGDLGRFISVDPIADGVNWYMAFGNDPVNFADPSGLAPNFHPLASPTLNAAYINPKSAANVHLSGSYLAGGTAPLAAPTVSALAYQSVNLGYAVGAPRASAAPAQGSLALLGPVQPPASGLGIAYLGGPAAQSYPD